MDSGNIPPPITNKTQPSSQENNKKEGLPTSKEWDGRNISNIHEIKGAVSKVLNTGLKKMRSIAGKISHLFKSYEIKTSASGEMHVGKTENKRSFNLFNKKIKTKLKDTVDKVFNILSKVLNKLKNGGKHISAAASTVQNQMKSKFQEKSTEEKALSSIKKDASKILDDSRLYENPNFVARAVKKNPDVLDHIQYILPGNDQKKRLIRQILLGIDDKQKLEQQGLISERGVDILKDNYQKLNLDLKTRVEIFAQLLSKADNRLRGDFYDNKMSEEDFATSRDHLATRLLEGLGITKDLQDAKKPVDRAKILAQLDVAFDKINMVASVNVNSFLNKYTH